VVRDPAVRARDLHVPPGGALGLPATALFLPPAALISFVLLRKHRRESAAHAAAAQRAGRDRWGPFAALTGIEALRSVAFFGLNTFIELHWIRDRSAPSSSARR
jgi:MFS transporter, FSR family, fosmidomycin resistance protein